MREYLPHILLLALGVLFFAPFFFVGQIPLPADILNFAIPTIPGHPYNYLISDTIVQLFPYKIFALENLKNLHIPLWNPYLMSGMPFMANVQSAVFYPLNLLGFVLDNKTFYGILIFSQHILGSLFMYLFLRELKLNKVSALFGAFAFIYSAPFTAWLEWGTIASTLAWLPLVLYFLTKSAREAKLKFTLGASFALAMSIFAGHFQFMFYIFSFALLYSLAWHMTKPEQPLGRRFILALAPFALAIGLGAIQLLPSIQASSSAYRDLATDYRALDFFPISHLVSLFLPSFFGDPVSNNYWGAYNFNEVALYPGIVVSFFVILSVLALRKNKKLWLFYTLALCTFLLLFPTPLFGLLFRFFPPIRQLPSMRITALLTFFWIIIGAIGFDQWFFSKQQRKTKTIFFVCFGTLLLLILLFLPQLVSRLPLHRFDADVFQAHLQENQKKIILLYLSFSAVLLFALYLPFVRKRKHTALGLAACFCLVSTVHMFLYAQRLTPFFPREYVYPENVEFINFLQNDPEVFRIYSDHSLGLDVYMPYKIASVNGYDSLYPKQYREFLTAGSEQIDIVNPLFSSSTFSEILDVLNTKYYLTRGEFTPEYRAEHDLELVLTDGEEKVYKNKNYLPRTFLVGNCRQTSDDEILEKIKSRTLDFRTTAYLEQAVVDCLKLPQAAPEDTSRGLVTIQSYKAERVQLRTRILQTSILVFTDAYVPGWRAYVNGEEQKILKTDYDFRGLYLEPGKYEIEFKYIPTAFVWGAVITIVSLVILAFVSLVIYNKKLATWFAGKTKK